MATPEFEATGKTEFQRIYQAGVTAPKTGSVAGVTSAADRFAEDFLRDAPEAAGLARTARQLQAEPDTAVDPFADLSGTELMEVFNRVRAAEHELNLGEAARLSRIADANA